MQYDKNGNAIIEDVFIPEKIMHYVESIRKLNNEEFSLMSHALHKTTGIVLTKFPKLPTKAKIDESVYDLIIDQYPVEYKIQVVKNIREFTGDGLYDAKMRSEKLPCIIKSRISKYEAEKIQSKFKHECPGIEITLELSLI